MEMLIVAVGLFLVWTLLDRFGESLDSVQNMANSKVSIESTKQKQKHRKILSKIQEKISTESEPILSQKVLDKILDGKSTYTIEMAKLMKEEK